MQLPTFELVTEVQCLSSGCEILLADLVVLLRPKDDTSMLRGRFDVGLTSIALMVSWKMRFRSNGVNASRYRFGKMLLGQNVRAEFFLCLTDNY